jgi:hypothetical protein
MASSKRRKKTVTSSALPELPDPTERERKAIAAARKNLDGRPRPVRLTISKSADGQLNADAPHSDGRGWIVRLVETFGSVSPEFALEQLKTLMSGAKADASPEDRTMAVNAMLAAVASVQPQNETEAMLAVQMAKTHEFAVALLDRAKQAQHVPTLESYGNMAMKLLRTYTAQVEALAKLRRGGNQTVRVEHVHVHPGGQAIVGNVTHPGAGGGGNKNGDQPYAPGADNEEVRRLTAEPVAPLWSEHPQREPMPVAGGERAGEVPDAWGRKR